MKYTYMGFSQEKLVEYGMDLVDTAILRYFIDFKDSGAMIIEIVEDKPYYWVKYEELIDNNPIFNIKSKDVLRRRLKKLVDCGVLIHYHKKKGGSFSFYGVGENYKNLISDQSTKKQTTKKSEGSKNMRVQSNRSKGYDSKVEGEPTRKSEGCDSKVGTKDSSIKDSSIKNINLLNTHTKEQVEEVMCVLDKKITFEEAKEILEIAEGDVELIKEKYEVAKTINYVSLIAVMKKAIKDNWQMPKSKPVSVSETTTNIKTRFHNFKGRTGEYSREQINSMFSSNKRANVNKDYIPMFVDISKSNESSNLYI